MNLDNKEIIEQKEIEMKDLQTQMEEYQKTVTKKKYDFFTKYLNSIKNAKLILLGLILSIITLIAEFASKGITILQIFDITFIFITGSCFLTNAYLKKRKSLKKTISEIQEMENAIKSCNEKIEQKQKELSIEETKEETIMKKENNNLKHELENKLNELINQKEKGYSLKLTPKKPL